jgi:glycosyltransferase involved in cell wall biosynthesis
LLRAFGEALAEVPHAVLLVAGAPLFNRDDEYLELLKRTTSDLSIGDKVRMLGARDDIGALMQALDVLIVNSSVEPFGLVILEAMACGTPVLAAAVDGIPEIIEHDENGWLFPPRDEAALAQAIVNLCRQPKLRARLAEQGQQHVAAHFSADRYITELQAFYLSLAREAGDSIKPGVERCETPGAMTEEKPSPRKWAAAALEGGTSSNDLIA